MKIIIFGSTGLVGSSLSRVLPVHFPNATIIYSKRENLNLFSYKDTYDYLNKEKPDVVVNAAAKVGGINANNNFRTEFILENLKINMNILESLINLQKTFLINLGSSCIYPINVKNPISEQSLMSGILEPTNSPYAMAKLTAIEIGDAISKQYGNKIINLMPTNLYGPNDNFDNFNSHVIPGLIQRMHKAKINNEKVFNVWGSGKPLREFLYVDDLSKAIAIVIKKKPDFKLMNIGSGEEISISNLVKLLKKILKYDGEIIFNLEMPDGNPRKLLDSSLINSLGWKSETNLLKGLNFTYDWYLNRI